MSNGVLSGCGGGSLSITLDLSSSKNIEKVIMLALVRNGEDTSIFSDDSGGVSNLPSGSVSTTGGFVWLIGGKGGSDKEIGVSIILDISRSTCCIVDTWLIRSRR